MRFRRNLNIWIIGGMVICLILVVQSCSRKKQKPVIKPGAGIKSGSPEMALKKYIDALIKGDYSKSAEFISASSINKMGGSEEYFKKMALLLQDDGRLEELKQTTVVNARMEGDTAYLKLKYPELGDRENLKTREMKLVKENNEWKIEFAPPESENRE